MKLTSHKQSDRSPLPASASAFTWALLFLLAIGCSGEKKPEHTTATVVIKGSNTIGEELAPRLMAEYRKEHPDIEIKLENRGTGSGFYALFAGASDIAAASRGMVANEVAQARIRKVQLNDYVIGSYSVAVIVNSNSPLSTLTQEQVQDIFTGAVTNWKDVGASEGPIHLFVRDPVSGTALGFQELAMENKPYATNVTLLTNYAGIAQAVAGDKNAIGYATIQLASKPGVKGVSIGGVEPTHPAVKEGKYPYVRVLHLFTDNAKESVEARDFIQFVLSSRGQQIVDEMGFTPHS
jgi:phosphate transport system substrate-binding protein